MPKSAIIKATAISLLFIFNSIVFVTVFGSVLHTSPRSTAASQAQLRPSQGAFVLLR
jgi:hypothetical protein